MTTIPFFFQNTKSGKKEPFQPKDPNSVTIYSCGPTVYNFAHIGNIRSFLFVDVLRRALLLGGYKLNQSMNITDIDDKIIKESIKQNVSVEEFTKPWTDAFFKDLETLQVQKLEHYPKATESIDDMVTLVETLQSNGLAYERDGNVYFSIQKFNQYGELSKIDVSGMKSGVRYDADEYEKDDVRDFVLWKNQKTKEEKCWHTRIGMGRPGWHLECSAMIRKIYGTGIDIHTGGIDLLFPHHENEFAQSVGAYPEETFVGTWLHCEHLLVDGEKMSKSKGNFYTLRDILNKGFEPRAIRFHLISAHYRSKLNFSLGKLEESKVALDRIQNTIFRLLELNPSVDLNTNDWNQIHFTDPEIQTLDSDFLNAIADDLNVPKALATLYEFVRLVNQSLDQTKEKNADEFFKQCLGFFYKINSLFAVFSFEKQKETLDGISEDWILDQIANRKLAKQNKDFATADNIRKELEKIGILLTDTKEGNTTWKKAQ
ncbi:cysteine--tRNA ligase [Leptospira biflexa]|uniref:Cysteine--tRNA ligase n=1 Tax=Leptospira biflexa serovar Patoc (strain Patoc 1 / ATCC 23582 / Paris) TaxID=456481 RepID=B0SRN6_LEPBP|nr:cysteine--tRNA ligase [Leptospira biflexa]ABZ94179.1 Cysteine--tRNA ligase [Leptospira biflexa serovar Patoc strain 'Patoc 1 (Ames)']ABZ97831.1 Cysteinyl-tRNA synthetase (Cysteine--tRNA ligase) [Leptospira biflexa serovar Patoc strain 'Patoc 1 (Paris)']TGM48542.1 cysteine--tRNA ligase [Leptospira biflexa]TGM48993.1 cysteine--tRNA ligase [Leptospira biflexa]